MVKGAQPFCFLCLFFIVTPSTAQWWLFRNSDEKTKAVPTTTVMPTPTTVPTSPQGMCKRYCYKPLFSHSPLLRYREGVRRMGESRRLHLRGSVKQCLKAVEGPELDGMHIDIAQGRMHGKEVMKFGTKDIGSWRLGEPTLSTDGNPIAV